jgi:hypothetical protein
LDRGWGKPALRLLSLGAGVQSLTVLLLACEGKIPKFDHALLADTGWEPRAVHVQLAKATAVAERAGIPVRLPLVGHGASRHVNPKMLARLDELEPTCSTAAPVHRPRAGPARSKAST